MIEPDPARQASNLLRPSPSRNLAGVLCTALLVLTAASLALANFHPGARPYEILTKGPAADEQRYAQLDALALDATRNGNALIVFDVQEADWRADSKLHVIDQIFCRESYVVYPRRVFIGDETVPFRQDQLSVARFDPTPKWLQEHDIRSVITVTRKPDGSYTLDLRRL
jgi:hypothetical protein